jgi:hypothetical protein
LPCSGRVTAKTLMFLKGRFGTGAKLAR